MNAYELYGLLNSVPIVHSGTIFHQEIPNYFFLHKAELHIPNKPNYVSITWDYFSLILDLTPKGSFSVPMLARIMKPCIVIVLDILYKHAP